MGFAVHIEPFEKSTPVQSPGVEEQLPRDAPVDVHLVKDPAVDHYYVSVLPVSGYSIGGAQIGPDDMSDDLHEARTMTEVGTKLDLARAYVDMGDPAGARSILEEVLDEGDEGQRQQAQQLLDSLPG